MCQRCTASIQRSYRNFGLGTVASKLQLNNFSLFLLDCYSWFCIHGFIFLVFYSWDNTLVSYSWVYIPVFIFQVLQSWFIFLDSYFWFYIPGCIFLVYIPGFFPGFRFMCLDSCFYIPGMIFLVCITGIIFLVL